MMRRLAVILVAAGALVALAVCRDDPAAEAGKGGSAAAVAGGKPGAPPKAIADKVQLEPVVKKLKKPLLVTSAPGDPASRIFVVEQPGRIKIVEGGQVLDPPFFDLTGKVSGANEQGVLGLAFHPDYQKNRRFFVHYTDTDGDSRVVEYKTSADDPNRADMSSARELLKVDQPYSNHNGGNVVVGPDGWLWIGFGDGGAANDPHGAGQDDKTLLAKMVRIDPEAASPEPVVHMKGLRNPWRYAFDAKTGDLYVADVGQSQWEEVHVLSAADAKKGGQNFGWNIMEGSHCFRAKSCDKRGLELPVAEYDHKAGCSITGGGVYRGKALPALDGVYFYADYCTGLVRSFRWKNGKISDHWDWKGIVPPLAQVSSFGTDSAGELYLVSQTGVVYRLAPK